MNKQITTLTGEIAVIVFLIFITIGVIIWLLGAYHSIQMFRGTKPGKRLIAQINPLSLFFEKYFTEEGNHHRIKSLKLSRYFMVSLLGALGAWYVAHKYG